MAVVCVLGGVVESGDLFVYAVRDCGCGRWVSCLFWRGLMTLRGEAVAAEVVSMGRLYWTLGLGKNARENWRRYATGLGILKGCAAAVRCVYPAAGRQGPRGRAG